MKQAKSLKQGFSLMEMMVVLLIVSIVAAASAPMISKKMVRSASGTSPWVWAGTQGGIAFNMSGNDNATMTVGAINDESNSNSRIFIKRGTQDVPFITLRYGSENLKMSFADKCFAFNTNGEANENCVAIGSDAEATATAAVAYNPSTPSGIALLASKTPAAKKRSHFKNYKADITINEEADYNAEWRDIEPIDPPAPPAPRGYQPPALSGNGGATSIGNTAKAQGLHSTAVGFKSKATTHAMSIGAGAEATGERSVAAGKSASAAGTGSISLGSDARADNGSIALGYGSRANGAASNAIGIGREVEASGHGAIAIGSSYIPVPLNGGGQRHTVASAKGAVAIQGSASALFATAIHGIAEGQSSCAMHGYTTEAAEESVAISGSTTAERAIAIGSSSQAEAARSIAIGSLDDGSNDNWATVANGTDSIALGTNAWATSGNSIAIGNLATTANANAGVAIGPRAHAYYTNSVAIGGDAVAGGSYINQSVHNGSESQAAPAIVTFSFPIIGDKTFSLGGRYATAIGVDAQARAQNSTAIGSGAYAQHPNSTAIGRGAATTTVNQIVLGTANDTVFIPGNLVVAGYGMIGNPRLGIRNANSYDAARELKYIWRNNTAPYLYYGGGGTSDPSWQIWSNQATSDRRLKNVGEAFKGGLEQIRKLEVFNYTFKKDPDKTPRIGVMAQDLQKIFPNAVTKGDDGFLRIRMEDMFYALVNAVKELDSKVTALSEQFKTNLDVVAKLKATVDSQNEEIKALKAKNTELEKKNTSLEKKTDDIEKRLAKLESKKSE